MIFAKSGYSVSRVLLLKHSVTDSAAIWGDTVTLRYVLIPVQQSGIKITAFAKPLYTKPKMM